MGKTSMQMHDGPMQSSKKARFSARRLNMAHPFRSFAETREAAQDTLEQLAGLLPEPQLLSTRQSRETITTLSCPELPDGFAGQSIRAVNDRFYAGPSPCQRSMEDNRAAPPPQPAQRPSYPASRSVSPDGRARERRLVISTGPAILHNSGREPWWHRRT